MSEPPATIKRMDEIYALSITNDRMNGSPAGSGAQDLDAPLVPLERLEERICELAAHLAFHRGAADLPSGPGGLASFIPLV
jgi:hypothetical protein